MILLSESGSGSGSGSLSTPPGGGAPLACRRGALALLAEPARRTIRGATGRLGEQCGTGARRRSSWRRFLPAALQLRRSATVAAFVSRDSRASSCRNSSSIDCEKMLVLSSTNAASKRDLPPRSERGTVNIDRPHVVVRLVRPSHSGWAFAYLGSARRRAPPTLLRARVLPDQRRAGDRGSSINSCCVWLRPLRP